MRVAESLQSTGDGALTRFWATRRSGDLWELSVAFRQYFVSKRTHCSLDIFLQRHFTTQSFMYCFTYFLAVIFPAATVSLHEAEGCDVTRKRFPWRLIKLYRASREADPRT